MEGLACNGPSGFHCLRMVKRPMDTAIESAEAVFFRRMAETGPVPGNPPQLRPQHLIGGASLRMPRHRDHRSRAIISAPAPPKVE